MQYGFMSGRTAHVVFFEEIDSLEKYWWSYLLIWKKHLSEHHGGVLEYLVQGIMLVIQWL